VLVSPAGAQINLGRNATVRAQFVGASPQAHICGGAEQTGKINYLTGNRPAQWRTGIPTFAQVDVENLYPGINAVYYGNDRLLEYDLTVSPGASPKTIALRFEGAEKISVNEAGELILSVGHSQIRQPKPVIYQTVAGARHDIDGGYKIVAAQTVAFAVGQYDHHVPLTIDPILSYSAYFGGTLGQTAWAVAINTNDGSVFIAGQTMSKYFETNSALPFATNASQSKLAFQTNFAGGIYLGDAFIAKFNHNNTLEYVTYLGGSADDVALALAVDGSGHAFVGGYTDSTNFPIVFPNGYHGVQGLANSTQISGTADTVTGYYPLDGFVAELETNGSSLIYSTYLGGSFSDGIYGLAIDGADNVYVTGFAYSTNLPVKNPVAFQLLNSTNQFLNAIACSNYDVNCNAFVAKISNLGTNLDYLTYFGGNDFDVGHGIAVDISSNVYITGFTGSTNFPNKNSFQAHLNNASLDYTNLDFAYDAFVAKFAPINVGLPNESLELIYSSYLGGTNNDEGYQIAVDDKGAAYVTGWTASTNFYNTTTNYINLAANATNVNFTNIIFPVIQNGMTNLTYYNGFTTTNVFLTKITNNETTGKAGIAYSVVFGGRFSDIGYGVAVDPAGNAFVTGSTTSTNFPVYNCLGLLRATNESAYVNSYVGYNAFVTAFNTNCSQVLYSVYLGGSANDFGYAIAVDSADTAYVVGQTSSTNFPVTSAITNFPIASALSYLPAGTNGIPNLPNGTNSFLNGTNDAFLAKISLYHYPAPSLLVSPVSTNLVFIKTEDGTNVTKGGKDVLTTNRVTSAVTLSWSTSTNPEIGSTYYVESSTNLATNVWVVVPNLPTITTNSATFTNSVTLPNTNRSQFFRLYQTIP
jgi:hypothetical protein